MIPFWPFFQEARPQPSLYTAIATVSAYHMGGSMGRYPGGDTVEWRRTEEDQVENDTPWWNIVLAEGQ